MLILIIIAMVSGFIGDKVLYTTNDHVTIELRAPVKISQSKTNEISLFLLPNEGIHINTEPMFDLVLEKNSPFEIVGPPRFLKNEKDYLDLKKPVEYSIKIKSGIKPGKQKLVGKFSYFYCSDKDGWCNRFVQQIDLTIEIIK